MSAKIYKPEFRPPGGHLYQARFFRVHRDIHYIEYQDLWFRAKNIEHATAKANKYGDFYEWDYWAIWPEHERR